MAFPAIEPLTWTPFLSLCYRALFNDSLAVTTAYKRIRVKAQLKP
jgi:hypothetical protein